MNRLRISLAGIALLLSACDRSAEKKFLIGGDAVVRAEQSAALRAVSDVWFVVEQGSSVGEIGYAASAAGSATACRDAWRQAGFGDGVPDANGELIGRSAVGDMKGSFRAVFYNAGGTPVDVCAGGTAVSWTVRFDGNGAFGNTYRVDLSFQGTSTVMLNGSAAGSALSRSFDMHFENGLCPRPGALVPVDGRWRGTYTGSTGNNSDLDVVFRSSGGEGRLAWEDGMLFRVVILLSGDLISTSP